MQQIRRISVLLVIIFSASTLLAQYDYEDRLRLEITPYVWMATMNGNLTINGENRYINFTFADFFKFSNLGLNGHVELKTKKWALLFDWNYVDLLKDQTYTELSLGEIGFAYRLFGKTQLVIGGRYFRSTTEYRDDPDNVRKGEESWIDPIVGGRLSWDLTKKFVFTFRADVGGFGIGSKFQWNLMSGIGYRLSNITFLAAYRIWYANYENGSGDNLFAYDVTTSGPGLAMEIHF
jgi:hypothetical protein